MIFPYPPASTPNGLQKGSFCTDQFPTNNDDNETRALGYASAAIIVTKVLWYTDKMKNASGLAIDIGTVANPTLIIAAGAAGAAADANTFHEFELPEGGVAIPAGSMLRILVIQLSGMAQEVIQVIVEYEETE